MPKINALPSFKVPRAALMAWVFGYDGSDRENLRTIHFESSFEGPRKDGVRKIHAVATDGSRMIHIWWCALPDDVLEGPFEIDAEAVGLMFEDLDPESGETMARGERYEFRIGTDGGNYIVVIRDPIDDDTAWFAVGPIDHSRSAFPQWRAAIPEWQEGEHSYPIDFGINFEYVLDFHDFLMEFNHGTNMRISCPGVPGQDAMIFAPTMEGSEDYDVDFFLLDQATAVEYILMPVKLS